DLTLSTVPAQLPADLSAVEPLAVRLAVLRHHYRRPLELNADELHQAERTLSEWRTAVASWAESPSAPMAAEPVARIQDALDDDLDTPAALAGMAALAADESVSPGSRFESFMHLDRTFALDLASRIGR
ncbi:MAG: hypothetical protein HOY71_14065, partial [Nonomuraea sp.]|nr:hypothetical protein [Nonomuraea sp.]